MSVTQYPPNSDLGLLDSLYNCDLIFRQPVEAIDLLVNLTLPVSQSLHLP